MLRRLCVHHLVLLLARASFDALIFCFLHCLGNISTFFLKLTSLLLFLHSHQSPLNYSLACLLRFLLMFSLSLARNVSVLLILHLLLFLARETFDLLSPKPLPKSSADLLTLIALGQDNPNIHIPYLFPSNHQLAG
jgi:hypothetical protein